MDNPATALIELREHYRNLLTQYEREAAHAKSQLEHVEVLLLDSLLPEPVLPTLEASLAADLPALPAASESKVSPTVPPSGKGASRSTGRVKNKSTKATPVTNPTPEPEVATASPVADPPPSQAIVPKGKKAPNASKGKAQGPALILPLPPEFAALKKIDAVAHILAESPGAAVHVDHIIERLYGDLSVQDYKAEKVRMKDVMARGIRRGLWEKAPVPMSYFVAAPVQATPVKPPTKTAAKPKTGRVPKTTPTPKKGPSKKPEPGKAKKLV
ncbi:MAG: hypothetical protein WCD18_22775 [Thermosynechococcaceae cyanobacterium]